jgi:flagellar hook assembly protein FlgD
VIAYTLSKSADVTIYIYDMNGDLVWRQEMKKGQNGGVAGNNMVVWNGEASFGNKEVLANGVYIVHLIAKLEGEKRSIGRTKIYILN